MRQLCAPFEAHELAEFLGEALGPEQATKLSSELNILTTYLNDRAVFSEYQTELKRVRAKIKEESK